jgi:hypothetical protein
MLPSMVLAKFVCWMTIVTELGVVPCILIPQLNYWAVIANIIFQSGLLLFTGTTFTLFFYSMTAASLAFVAWPEGPVPVLYDPRRGSAERARRFFQSWDFDERFLWTPSAAAQAGLRLMIGEKVYSGFRALRMLVLLNPVTYFAIAASIAALGDFPGPAVLCRRLIVGTCLVFLMPPLAWIADMWFSGGNPQSRSVARTAES